MQKPRAEHFALTIDNQIYVFGGDEDSSIGCLDEVKGGWNLSGKLLEKRLLPLLFRERLETRQCAYKVNFTFLKKIFCVCGAYRQKISLKF